TATHRERWRCSARARLLLAALGPLEDRRAHAVPRAALRTAPVPADAVQAALLALIAPAGIPDPREQQPERGRLRRRAHVGQIADDLGELSAVLERQGGRQQPRELTRAHATRAPQPGAELLHDVTLAQGAGDRQDPRHDLEREPRGALEGMQVALERATA